MLRMYTLCLAGIIGLGLAATGCGSGGGGGGGYFDAAWDFGGATCSSAGATEVEIDVRDVRTGLEYSDIFACAAYGGTTGLLPVDDYTVALSAYESASATTPISTTDFNGEVYSIYDGIVTSLPGVTFAFHH
jgi:hypothetical protein